jgi:HK97 family phage major capsid protein/HK97 family phage prohead protease
MTRPPKPTDPYAPDGFTDVRDAAFTREAINVEARTVELAFSSEEPYDRWWGREILSHARSAVRLQRLEGGRHPLLVDHSTRDQVGVVERAWIGDDRRARAVVRFGRSPRANEIFQDVQDGIRSLVSVGYRIHDMVLAKSGDQGDEYLVDDWEPYEVSIVAVPADPTVGVGRSDARDRLIRSFIDRARSPIPNPATTRSLNPSQENPAMDDDTVTNPPARTETRNDNRPPARPADPQRERQLGTEQERQRVRDIQALGDKFGKRAQADAAIDAGTSFDAFRESVFTALEQSGTLRLAEPAEIGMSKKEVQQFRFTNLIAASLWPDDATVRKMAAFEIDAARAAADKRPDVRTERQGAFTVPVDVLSSPLDMRTADAETASKLLLQRAMAGARLGQRDLVVGTPAAGGNLVATELLASSFIDYLVNALAVMGLGATMLTDLQGNIAIPRATGGHTGYWVAENSAPTESQPAFDQVALTPKTCGAFVDYGRRLLLQASVAVEAFVRMDIARTISLMIDLAAVTGSGTGNQPRGLLNTSGIGSVAGGANGAAPTWDHIVDLESAVANANAPASSLAYLTNTRVRGKLKRTQKFTGTNGDALWRGGELNDTRAQVSNQVPSNLTKGSSTGICSAILYGNWADLLLALWGGLDIMLDPYTGGTAGTRRVVALQDVDVNVRYPVSFSAMQDALTS